MGFRRVIFFLVLLSCQTSPSLFGDVSVGLSQSVSRRTVYAINEVTLEQDPGEGLAQSLTLNGPAAGSVGVPSMPFTAGALGTLAHPIVVTPSDSGGGGTFAPASVTLTNDSRQGSFTYTAASSGSKSISLSNDVGLTNPSALVYTVSSDPILPATALTLLGSSTGIVDTPASFTIGGNGVLSASITAQISVSAGNGSLSDTQLVLSPATPWRSFTYTAHAVQTVAISVTNISGLTNPGPLLFSSVVAPALPSWVPPAGEVAVLTQSNGKLSNYFSDIVAPYYEPFYSKKIVNDYSTHVVNEHWGPYGALVGFGGGHAATNDNSVWLLELGANACTFKRLNNPTPHYGIGTDPTTKFNNSIGGVMRETTYGEYTMDGQPQSPHSYGALDILGPADGGGTYGSLYQVASAALAYGGSLDVLAAHKMDFSTTTGVTGSYNWSRVTNNIGTSNPIPPAWTMHVPTHQRIYIETRSATAEQPPRWFDLATKTYVVGTGTARQNNGDNSDTGILLYVPERGLLVFADRHGGQVRLQYMDVSVPQPAWVNTVALSQNLPAVTYFQSAAWCPDNQRIIIGGIAGDNSAVYEVEIPANLSQPWIAVRAPFGAGQTFSWPGGGEGSSVYKKWSYNRKVRAILMYFPASSNGDDVIQVYRPRGT